MLKDSTSGGLFTAFSREIFKRGGVCYGCAWDQEYHALVCKAENEEEIKPMRGSKYVWSWAGDTFPEIKSYLEEGRPVLFTGLPCQLAGLRKYLRKDYDNFFSLCFFCGGSPSPFAFHEYLKTLTKKVPLDELKFNARDKEKYGLGVHITYQTPKGKACDTYLGNAFYYSFYTKVVNRRSCYQCPYRYEHRVEDLTMGDYWGVRQFHDEFDIKAGVSALLVNTEKGRELLDSVRDQLQLSPTEIANIAKANNLTLGEQKKIYPIPAFRDDFFEVLHRKGWKAAERKYLLDKSRLMVLILEKTPPRYRKTLRRMISIVRRKGRNG